MIYFLGDPRNHPITYATSFQVKPTLNSTDSMSTMVGRNPRELVRNSLLKRMMTKNWKIIPSASSSDNKSEKTCLKRAIKSFSDKKKASSSIFLKRFLPKSVPEPLIFSFHSQGFLIGHPEFHFWHQEEYWVHFQVQKVYIQRL